MSGAGGRQLAFDLPVRTAGGRDDFFVSEANATAVHALDGWAGWPLGKLVLTGPAAAGKSHLVRIWAEEAGGVVAQAATLAQADVPALAAAGAVAVEDVPRLAGSGPGEAALFHLHNLLAETGGRLLLTGRGTPGGWGLALPDLASRVAQAQAVALAPPDDALLRAVLVKLFADRQLAPAPRVVDYLAARMDRSFAEAQALVAALDAAALSGGERISTGLARRVLEARALDRGHPAGP
jgi:chromosomal replication initiation ATPase DnaA